ncbi:MAG: hypothetical protein AAF611_03485 [Bacteroidota bacterium]
MITKKQREKLREILGYHYTKEVFKLLKERKVTNKKGNQYSSSMIRNVYNGINENKDIENAIFDVCIKKMEEKEKETKRRNQILDINSSIEN